MKDVLCELVLQGNTINAEESFKLGLVSNVIPSIDLAQPNIPLP